MQAKYYLVTVELAPLKQSRSFLIIYACQLDRAITETRERITALNEYIAEYTVSKLGIQEYAMLIDKIDAAANFEQIHNIINLWTNEIEIIINHKYESNGSTKNDTKKTLVRLDRCRCEKFRVSKYNPPPAEQASARLQNGSGWISTLRRYRDAQRIQSGQPCNTYRTQPHGVQPYKARA